MESPSFNGKDLEIWQQNRVLKQKLSLLGNLKVFCFDIDYLQLWPPLAMNIFLLDMVGPRGPGSLEDCTWNTVYQGLRLCVSGNKLFLASMASPADLLSRMNINSDFNMETPQAPTTITEMKRKTGGSNKKVCVAGSSGAGKGDRDGPSGAEVGWSGAVGGSGGQNGGGGSGGSGGGGSGGYQPSGGRGADWKCKKCEKWNLGRRPFCFYCKTFRVADTPPSQNCDPDVDMQSPSKSPAKPPAQLRFPIIFDPQSFSILREILVGLGLEEYADDFARNHIDLDLFMDMTEADIISIGITSFGAQRILVDAIKELRGEN